MDNAIYVSLARQITLFRDMDVTAQNIANSDTSGYSGEHILFDSYLANDNNNGYQNKYAFPTDLDIYRNTENGALKATGNEMDFAIQGNGYFTVETPLGKRYTRSGNFQVSGTGVITTPEGYAVLDATGRELTLPEGTTKVEVGEAGNIKVNGDDYGIFGIVQFDNPKLLERISGKLFKSDIVGQPATNIRVNQGMLEASNVQPVMELTHMTTLNHAIADTATLIAVAEDLARKASNAWAQQS